LNTQKIGVKQFRQIALKELSADNNFLAGWVPNSIIDHAVDPLIGKLRPWTKAGREYHNFYRNFYCTLAWTKLWKICKFDQTSWNLDDEVIRNVSNKFNFLIEYALDNIDENLFDDERNVDPKDWLENYNPELISRYTAMDHLFQNITNNPIKNVLDFGSGIGRQAFQWFKPEDGTEGVNLFSVDAIESLYVLQNKIYSLLYPKHLREYFYDQETF